MDCCRHFPNHRASAPSFNGTLPLTLLKPALVGVGIGLVCCIFIFPESTSHLVLYNMQNLLSSVTSSVDLTTSFLALGPDSIPSAQVQGLRMKLIGDWKVLEPSMAFLKLDISFGTYNIAN